jgi:N-acetylmuramoyl-L-alanine amidase
MKLRLTIFVALISFSNILAQQVTGLAGWNIYLDPGHSQDENMGIYGYSEAKKNLRVGMNLRQMLLDWTDIDTAYICRTNDQQQVTLGQRTDQANQLGAAWYHSIHSDASDSPDPNSTLLLWGQYSNGLEKIPNGGKAMSNIMVKLLTAGMRIPTRGSVGDCSFYGGCSGSGPYLWVNRETNMPSELSEAGFHTNPKQNQLNMNASWKRLEAKTFWWSILRYHNIQRPFVGTVTGIVKDIESGLAINGALLNLNGQTDTTDTWQSLFYLYSGDPNLLRNGFYYFENIPPGTFPINISAPGYEPLITDVTLQDTFFTFKDIELISTVPPVVIATSPEANDSLYPGYNTLSITFSRPMNRTSVESNIQFSPAVSVTFSWSNGDKKVDISTGNFLFQTQYQVTILGTAEGKYGHLFDGNGDGVGGDPLTFSIYTKVQDILPPEVVSVYPPENSSSVELNPVLNISFNEKLNTSGLSNRFKVVKNSDQTNATGILRHYAVGDRSVLNFFCTSGLAENESYTIKLLPGIKDIFGNQTVNEIDFVFSTGNFNYNERISIDDFESGITNWWQPEQSSSTVGIIPEQTEAASSTGVLNLLTGSSKSMLIQYAWNLNATNWLLREFYKLSTPTFNNSGLLQVYLFGDGTNNKFRFTVNDQGPGGHEVSPWYPVDWIGWKLVSWDLAVGETGTWIGNGILEPPLSFDSFQMTYEQGNQSSGYHYFDDLRIATADPTGIEQVDNSIPAAYDLEQNFPNPFNPSTSIKFSMVEEGNANLIISDILGREIVKLVDDNLKAGTYSINFDASDLSSGVYFYTLITKNFKQSKKMILIK